MTRCVWWCQAVAPGPPPPPPGAFPASFPSLRPGNDRSKGSGGDTSHPSDSGNVGAALLVGRNELLL